MTRSGLHIRSAAELRKLPGGRAALGEKEPTEAVKRRKADLGGYDSKPEKLYAQELELQRLTGKIADWRHHYVTLHLDATTRYTPDFLVVRRGDVAHELHEVKGKRSAGGRVDREGRVKIKWAAQRFPWWSFYLVTWEPSGWQVERVGGE